MNRFLKSKREKEKVKEEAEHPEGLHSSLSLSAKLSKKNKKEPVEEPKLDLAAALPPTDDFRTSLLMPKLSARFSMLREQDDPDSMIGKASDDSVLFPKRASRLNLFGHTPNFLADIDEVSTDGSRPSFGLGRTDSFASGGDGYGTDDDRSQKESVMSRGRRTEGNNLFGGRQKVYKIPAKSPTSEAARSGMSGRAVYEQDVNLSAFQRYRLQEREREGFTAEDSPSHESEDALSSISSAKRTTFSSTASGPTAYGRTSTAATSIDEQSFSNASGAAADSQTGPKPPLHGMAPERGSVKSRRLYGQGLAQSVQNQHNSALHRLESLSRQRAGTPELPVLNRSYSRSATNLRDRLQKLAIAEPTGQTSRPSSPPSSSASPTQHPVESGPREQKSQRSSPDYGVPPLSPPHSENDEAVALVAALQPEDHGKATAMGLFNKPRTAFDEEQFTRRQLQMHQGRNTPPLIRPSPTSGRNTPQEFSGRPRGPSTTSYRSHGGSVSSHYSEAQRPGSRSAGTSVNASPARAMTGTFFDNSTPSESEDEADYSFVHPALRSKTPSKPSTPTGEEASPLSTLPEVRYSDLGDLKPIAEQDAMSPPRHEEPLPEKPDSPTLGPSGLGLSGLVRTHLRSGSDRSSIFPPPSPGLPPTTFDSASHQKAILAESEPKEESRQTPVPHSVDLKQALNGSSWQGQIVAQHRRQGSTETQREREEFEHELAERRRKVQEKLKGIAESESRSASPVSGRQTPDYAPRPGNAFALLKSRQGKHSLFNRPESKTPKVFGLGNGTGNASTPALVTDDSWEEERPSFSFGKHSNSSSPQVSSERSMRSRMTAFGRSSQEDSRESSRSRGASPPSNYRRRDRSSSDASGRSKSRNRRDREDLGTLEEDSVGSYPRNGYPEIDTHGMNSVASSARPSVEVGDRPYDRASSVASGRHRSGSRSGTPSFHDQSGPNMSTSMIGAVPRPSPIAPYSANATPPLYDIPSSPGVPSAATYPSTIPQRAPGHSALQKRVINKTLISEPTFVSCTSNVPTVGLPPGASLSNGMETPPVPPMNPRRRRQTTTQTIIGAIKGEKSDSQHLPNGMANDESSTFSDEGERRPKSRHRLRKTSSEGGNLNAKARQQVMSGAPQPAMPTYPPPQVPMDGGMF